MENDFVYLESDIGTDLDRDISPNKLIDKINDLGKDIEAFEAKLKNVQLELDEAKKELEELKKRQVQRQVEELIKENNIEHLYTIQCHPSIVQNCNIKTHYVGLFLSEKDATACIPLELYSVDEREITWCYKVVPCNIPRNWDGSSKRPPYNFPYGRRVEPNDEYNPKYEYTSDINMSTI